MSGDVLTQADVQLHTGATPEKFAHMIRVAARGVPRPVDGPQEALCGYVFTPTGQKLLPCPACMAVFNDDEAMSLANP